MNEQFWAIIQYNWSYLERAQLSAIAIEGM